MQNQSIPQREGAMPSRETFSDGSTIDTDPITGNRTVFGAMAHTEYFKRLRAEQITRLTSPAIMEFCVNLDGTRKAELIRKVVTNPISREWLGEYSWEVWCSDDSENVVRYMTEEKARKAFKAACVHGTNGFASASEAFRLNKEVQP